MMWNPTINYWNVVNIGVFWLHWNYIELLIWLLNKYFKRSFPSENWCSTIQVTCTTTEETFFWKRSMFILWRSRPQSRQLHQKAIPPHFEDKEHNYKNPSIIKKMKRPSHSRGCAVGGIQITRLLSLWLVFLLLLMYIFFTCLNLQTFALIDLQTLFIL